MAITIDWGTKVISVPQADLTFVGGSVYTLDVDAFRLTLKSLEDDEDGISFPKTHNHNTEATLGGITYARLVEIINGYTITFEDGLYVVNLTGANNNVLDVTNLNQVSVRSNNSAGLVTVGTGISQADLDKLDELHRIQGLKSGEPMTVTKTSRSSGDISLTISGDGIASSTVTRT